MTHKVFSSVLQISRKRSYCILAFCWFFGLTFGIMIYASAAPRLASLMRSSVYGDVSIVTLLWVNLLPVLLSVVAVVLSAPAILLLICFARAVLLGFVSIGLLHCFGAQGWLFCGIHLFGDLAITPFLYLYWLWAFSARRTTNVCFLDTVSLAAVCIGLLHVEYNVIVPITACLIDFQKG